MLSAASSAPSIEVAVVPGGCGICELFQQLAEALAVFGQVDRLRRGADDAYPGGLQRQGKVQRRLPAELHDDADLGSARALVLVDGHHVFEGERLEVEAVAGVVVGGNRLGIAVHHHGFVAVFVQGEGGMAAAVVELNSLPDAVRPAAEDDDLLLRPSARPRPRLRRSNTGTACSFRTRRRRYRRACRPA